MSEAFSQMFKKEHNQAEQSLKLRGRIDPSYIYNSSGQLKDTNYIEI